MCVGFVCLVFTPNCASFTVFFFFLLFQLSSPTVQHSSVCVHVCSFVCHFSAERTRNN